MVCSAKKAHNLLGVGELSRWQNVVHIVIEDVASRKLRLQIFRTLKISISFAKIMVLLHSQHQNTSVSWSFRIYQMHLCRSCEYLEHDSRPSDVLGLWQMWSTHSLSLLRGPLWPRVVIPIRVLSMGQIELLNYLWYLKPLNCVQTNDSY